MSSPDGGTRLEQVLAELRESAPPAPDRLRARVDQLAAAEPARHPGLRERFSFRRTVLVLAPALLAIGVGAAVIGGISGSARDPGRDALRVEGRKPVVQRVPLSRAEPGYVGQSGENLRRDDASQHDTGAPAGSAAAAERRLRTPDTGLPAARGRAQDYRAALRLRVAGLDDLSRRTKEAIRLTRAWGGYVVSVDYAVPEREGDARLKLRVPVQHVQAAVQRFSELGTILAQEIAIRDVQRQLDRHTRELLALRERIAKLRADLREPGLSERERARLKLRLARARRAVAERSAERAALARRASFATVSLTLTTRDAAGASAEEDGRIERAVEDAGAILAKELALALYALIVAAPFLVLAAAAYFAARAGRRRADDRLLERA